MKTFVGIDGIPGGWVAVYLSSDGNQRFASATSVVQLLSDPFERAMIDMPIGLPKRGYRQCDVEARSLVGSRVFLGARFGVWSFETLDQANAHYWETEGAGNGISIQLFCIRNKLRELNENSVIPQLFETHPELFFWRIAGRVLASKKSSEGRAERIEILEEMGIGEIGQWLQQRRRTGIRRDDLIDACACAVTARDGTNKLPTGEERANTDVLSEIWY
jgi:predicted RNase H-like nuclease